VVEICQQGCSCDQDCPESDCTDGIDNDGDGKIDCNDPGCLAEAVCIGCIDSDWDGYYAIDPTDCPGSDDCNDSEELVNPGATEGCGNSIDDDCDNLTDCNDTDCSESSFCTESSCIDYIDNDGDGLTDCDDSDCAELSACRKLNVTYSPENPTTDQSLVIYVRDNSTGELVTESYVDYKEPGNDTWIGPNSAYNGTYIISNPLAGTYTVIGWKTNWTDSDYTYIYVDYSNATTTSTTTTSTSTSTSTTSTTSTINVTSTTTSTTITTTLPKLSITYSPENPTTGQPLILYVRDNSTAGLVDNSSLSIKEPGSETYTPYSADNGTYTIIYPLAGTYTVFAWKTNWTASDDTYIYVEQSNATNATTTTTIPGNVTNTTTTTINESTSTTSTTSTINATTSTTINVTTSTSTSTTSTIFTGDYTETVDLIVPRPAISTVNVSGEIYNAISVSGYSLTADVSNPRLPMQSMSFAVPPDSYIYTESMQFQCNELETIKLNHTLLPAQEPVTNDTLDDWEFTEPNSTTYAQTAAYPEMEREFVSDNYIRGWRIVNFNVYPVRYAPASNEIQYCSDADITFDYYTQNEPTITQYDDNFKPFIDGLVKNPDKTDHWRDFEICAGDCYDYVIITGDEFQDEFQKLADWKTRKGIRAKVTNISSINSTYNGSDLQERIRAYIKWEVDFNNIEWVVLGGDVDVVPVRYLYNADTRANDAGYDDNWDNLSTPSDYYYAGLNGTWDQDGDGKYGERAYLNTNNIDEADWYADVYVGRFPVNTTAEVRRVVNKTIRYETDPGDGTAGNWENKALFIGAISNYDYEGNGYGATDEAELKDHIDVNHTPQSYSITKLYETTWDYPPVRHDLTEDAVLGNLSTGFGIVNTAGHGGPGIIWRKYDTDENSSSRGCTWTPFFRALSADSLGNGGKLPLWYSDACLVGAFDYKNDFVVGERLILAENGSIAFVGATRITWYYINDLTRGNRELDWRFWQEFFNYSDYHPGSTLYRSKMNLIAGGWTPGNEGQRKDLLAYNLLGDPEVPIWTATPKNLTKSNISATYFNASGPSENNDSQGYCVLIRDHDGNPVVNVTVVMEGYAITGSGIPPTVPFYSTGTTSENGWCCISAHVFPTLYQQGETYVTRITALKHNYIPNTLFRTTSGDAEVDVHPADKSVNINSKSDPLGATNGSIGKFFNLSTSDEINSTELKIHYTNSDISGIIESSLKMYRWNGNGWVVCDNTGVNAAENYVWTAVNEFGLFAPIGTIDENATTTTTTSTSTTSISTTSTTSTSTTSTSTTSTSITTTTLEECPEGDANCDGAVSDFELLDYIDLWVQGSVSDFELLDAIDNWVGP